MSSKIATLSNRAKDRARSLGFSGFGIVDLTALPSETENWLREFIKNGYHGTMQWMEDSLERRIHPKAMWPQAQSAIVLGYNYGPDTDPLETLSQTQIGTISVYARHKDYHGLIKGKLKELAGLIAQDLDCDVKVFVDTAPLMEKPLAAQAGLGWQGKHTNLVSRNYGSWLFLGVILSDCQLKASAPEIDHCGNCQACLDICPTDAFPRPYQLDARKCISYLTIEHKGPIPLDLREKMGNRIYGCDDCLAICPWNKFAQRTHDIKLQAKQVLNSPKLIELVQLTEEKFRSEFSGSPIKRIGHKQFLRNILYAIGNSSCQSLRPHAARHVNSKDPIVAEAAAWAVKRLS